MADNTNNENKDGVKNSIKGVAGASIDAATPAVQNLSKKAASKMVEMVSKKGADLAAKTSSTGLNKIAQELTAEQIPVLDLASTGVNVTNDTTNLVAESDQALKGSPEAQKKEIESAVNLLGTGIGASVGGVAAGVALGGAAGGEGVVEEGVEGAVVGGVADVETGVVPGAVVGGVVGAAGGGGVKGVLGAAAGIGLGAGKGAGVGQTIAGVVSPIIAEFGQPLAAPAFEMGGKINEKIKETTGFDGVGAASSVAKFAQPITNLASNPIATIGDHLKPIFGHLTDHVVGTAAKGGVSIEPQKIFEGLTSHFIEKNPLQGAGLSEFFEKNNAAKFLPEAIQNFSNKSSLKQDTDQKPLNVEQMLDEKPKTFSPMQHHSENKGSEKKEQKQQEHQAPKLK